MAEPSVPKSIAKGKAKGKSTSKNICGYEPLQKLGSGTYGKVYLAEKDKTLVAIKKAISTEEWLDESIIKEIDFLNRFDHPNVVKALETHVDMNKVCLIMEFYQNTLVDVLGQNKPFEVRLEIYKGVLCGLQYLHTNWVIHADLKPQNILIDVTRNRPAIADFGLSINFGPFATLENADPATTRSAVYQRPLVTAWWRPPELFGMEISEFLDKAPRVFYFFGPEIDVYSIAWIGMELLFDLQSPHTLGYTAPYRYLQLLGVNPGLEFGHLKKQFKFSQSDKTFVDIEQKADEEIKANLKKITP